MFGMFDTRKIDDFASRWAGTGEGVVAGCRGRPRPNGEERDEREQECG